MKKLQDIFDDIVILHCVENKEREQEVMKTMNQLDITNYRFYETVKCPLVNKILYNAMPNLHTDFYEKLSTSAQAGCFDCAYNWYKIVKIAFTKGLNTLLVFEDDALLNTSKEEADELINKIPDDFDIIKGSYCISHLNDELYNIINGELSWHKYKNEFNMYHSGMIGFSRKGMAYYIYIMEKYFIPADMPLYYVEEEDLLHLNYYIPSIPLIYDDLTKSDIVGNYENIFRDNLISKYSNEILPIN